MNENQNPLTSGPIYKPMMKFMLPVMFASLLQALYGAVDLLVIGRFVSTDPIVVQNATAAVGTGSMIMMLITYIISGLTMGVTVTLGRYIGANNRDGATKTVGSAVGLFAVFAVVLTIVMELGAPLFAKWMNAPDIGLTTQYLRICGAGIIFITAYNAISGLFRGIGNSKHPLIFVAIASVVNIVLDLILVCVFHMGVAGVAIATIFAQAVSVVLSLAIMKKIELPFDLSAKSIRFFKEETKAILNTGMPLAAQDFLTNISFVVINSVANNLGSDPSAWAAIASGYSVDNKLTTFMMILPVAFLQSMSVFTAQNMGAKQPERIRKGFRYMVFTTLGAGFALALLCFFGGEMLASIFTNDASSIMYAAQYLKGFAADMLVGCTVLMMLGYFNGCGHSTFVMFQGLFSAFCIRIPAVLLLSKLADVTLVHLGLGCAAASYSSLILCVIFFFVCKKKDAAKQKNNAEVHTDAALKPSKPGVIITIAREHGSSGKQIGKQIAQELGIPFYYKEVTALAAEESGLHREFISDINVNAPAMMKELYMSNTAVQQAVIAQSRIIKKIADNGSCVIVGRAADHVLKDYENVVRIFIYAPEAYKIQRVMEVYGDSEEMARKNVRRSDDARAAYYMSITGSDWRNVHNYDIAIDSSAGVEQTVGKILNMLNA